MFRSFVTNPLDPKDEIAIKIGKFYIDNKKQQKIELELGLADLREYEKERAYNGKYLFIVTKMI